jgi:hypothetical protein
MTALPQGRNIEVTLCAGAVGLNGPAELDWDFLGYHGIEWAVNAKAALSGAIPEENQIGINGLCA